MNDHIEIANHPWQNLYKAAIFEMDQAKAITLIADAENAIITRARALFNQPENAIERKALDNALYFLRILRNCAQSKSAA